MWLVRHWKEGAFPCPARHIRMLKSSVSPGDRGAGEAPAVRCDASFMCIPRAPGITSDAALNSAASANSSVRLTASYRRRTCHDLKRSSGRDLLHSSRARPSYGFCALNLGLFRSCYELRCAVRHGTRDEGHRESSHALGGMDQNAFDIAGPRWAGHRS
jgi:hypothetical protein